MTRFARARGSKGSNEKVPEEATSWNDMKKQLRESQIKQESSAIPAKPNVLQLLQDDTTSIKTEWATFEDKKTIPINTSISKKKLKQSLSNSLDSNVSEMGNHDVLSKTQDGKIKKLKKLKVKKSKISEMLGIDESKIIVTKKKRIPEVSNDLNDLDVEGARVRNGVTKQKNSKGKKLKSAALMDVAHVPQVNENGNGVEENNKNSEKDRSAANKKQKKKKLSKSEKIVSGKPYNRRKPLEKNMVMTINGKEISMSYFDGFIVKKEDAERLRDLQKKLKAKGIPGAEIKEAMKLERRKAEKALAREKKKVCFHCRNSGHVLSECPELATADSTTGICYKCGSTEHKVFECRVGKQDRYRFAQCFVCSEQGHISVQCPQNSKGVYPKGGSCHVCGEVTHLKRDCPKLQQEQESQQSQSLTVGIINGGSLEALDGETKPKSVNNFKKSKKGKRIVFG